MIYHTRGEHTNHYATDVVEISLRIEPIKKHLIYCLPNFEIQDYYLKLSLN